MTTEEVAKRINVSRATVAKWIDEGLYTPRAGKPFGRGYPVNFDAHDVARLGAVAALKRAFGDGELTRVVIAKVVPTVTPSTTALTIERLVIPLDATR